MEAEPEPANLGSQLIIIVSLTLINAFFAATEMAVVSANKNKIGELAEKGNRRAVLLTKLNKEKTKFLSTIQVGITLAGFFNSALAATGMSDDLARFLSSYNIPYNRTVALVIITIVLSYIILVFGELVPRRIALKNPEAIAMFSARPITIISKIVSPFVKLLSISANLIIRLTGLEKKEINEKISKEEIRALVEVGQEHGAINETEKEMIDSIFEFDDKLADEIMTPRTEVYMINIDTPISEYLDELLEEGYSRIPVYEEDVDNIIGILYMKDFIVEAKKHGFENVNIRSILRTPYFVPEIKSINDLFVEIQASKNHMAILIDEYGGFSGVVTVKDLVEEIIGDIIDEYDDEPDIKKIDNNTFIIDGMFSVDDFNDYFDANIEKEDYDTMSGFLIYTLGYLPDENEEDTIEYEDFVFKIEEVKEKRIQRIKVYH